MGREERMLLSSMARNGFDTDIGTCKAAISACVRRGTGGEERALLSSVAALGLCQPSRQASSSSSSLSSFVKELLPRAAPLHPRDSGGLFLVFRRTQVLHDPEDSLSSHPGCGAFLPTPGLQGNIILPHRISGAMGLPPSCSG